MQLKIKKLQKFSQKCDFFVDKPLQVCYFIIVANVRHETKGDDEIAKQTTITFQNSRKKYDG